ATAPALENFLMFALALHGGAGTIARAALTPTLEADYRAALRAALTIGSDLLAQGAPALDAVEATVRSLEDCPLFNARRPHGRGQRAGRGRGRRAGSAKPNKCRPAGDGADGARAAGLPRGRRPSPRAWPAHAACRVFLYPAALQPVAGGHCGGPD
nr:isoaspartyl peptidase/L-asparaginase 1 [Tanacetum cinerariifolium]